MREALSAFATIASSAGAAVGHIVVVPDVAGGSYLSLAPSGKAPPTDAELDVILRAEDAQASGGDPLEELLVTFVRGELQTTLTTPDEDRGSPNTRRSYYLPDIERRYVEAVRTFPLPVFGSPPSEWASTAATLAGAAGKGLPQTAGWAGAVMLAHDGQVGLAVVTGSSLVFLWFFKGSIDLVRDRVTDVTRRWLDKDH